MARIVSDVANYRAEHAWGARDLLEIGEASVRLHWTDRPYRWHVNDGPEAFVVLDGQVDMRYRVDGVEHLVRLGQADIFLADEGDEHIATPLGEARILVIERKGSA